MCEPFRVPEIYNMRLEGGPNPGDIPVSNDEHPYPGPGIIAGTGGQYERVAEIQIPVPAGEGYVTRMRGVVYQWRPDNQKESE